MVDNPAAIAKVLEATRACCGGQLGSGPRSGSVCSKRMLGKSGGRGKALATLRKCPKLIRINCMDLLSMLRGICARAGVASCKQKFGFLEEAFPVIAAQHEQITPGLKILFVVWEFLKS